jgi:cytochrome c oxidase subunit 2
MITMQAASPASPSWMPPNAAAHGFALDRLMHWNLLALAVLFVLAHLLFVVIFLRRPKASPQDEIPRTWKFQVVYVTFFCAMYLAMAITAQHLWALNRFEGAVPESMQVEVTGRQFQWYFRYPGPDATFGRTDPALINPANGNPLGIVAGDARGQDDIVASEFVLPVDREVDLTLRAQDVIHGFFIPAMRLKQNAVPGQTLHIHFTPVATGVFPVLCTQVCGLGHARMQARLRVVSYIEFQKWLIDKSAVAAQ